MKPRQAHYNHHMAQIPDNNMLPLPTTTVWLEAQKGT